MFITGPEVIKTVTHEVVDAETLGGAATHQFNSGVAHFVGQDEDDSFAIVKKILEYIPDNNTCSLAIVQTNDNPFRADKSLDTMVPVDPNETYNMIDVINGIVDKGTFFEVHANFATNAVVGFARLNGESVGIAANQPASMAGVLDINASDKIARFVRFCDAFNIPVISIVDTPGFMPGTMTEQNGIIRHGAKILYAFSEATVPKITVITRKAYGGAYIVMGSKHLRSSTMAEAVGARLTGLDRFYGHIQCCEALSNDKLWPYPILDLLATAAIVVDRHGKRFADEGLGGVYMTNAIAALDEPDTAAVIFDDAIWNGTGREYILPPNPNAVEAGGTLISHPDLGSLAQALGLPATELQASVDAHNDFVQNGAAIAPPRSNRAAQPQPIVKPPFHALRVCAGITYTMGGVAIDGGARVLDLSDHPIPGLYAAGSTTGGLEGGGPAGYTGGLSKALTLGLLAGESAARK